MSKPYPTSFYTNNSLCTSVEVEVPADLDALAQAFGAAAIYESSIRQAFYQGWNIPFREKVAAKLQEKFPEPARVVIGKKKNRQGVEENVYESEQVYVKNLLAENVISQEELDAIAQEIAFTIPFEIATSDSKKKVAPEFLATAKQFDAAFTSGKQSFEKFANNFANSNPGYTLAQFGADVDRVNAIAKALEIDSKRRAQESANALLGESEE